jgi:hypothetical protein
VTFYKTPIHPANLEARIAPLVMKLNKLPFVQTVQSCEGHIESPYKRHHDDTHGHSGHGHDTHGDEHQDDHHLSDAFAHVRDHSRGRDVDFLQGMVIFKPGYIDMLLDLAQEKGQSFHAKLVDYSKERPLSFGPSPFFGHRPEYTGNIFTLQTRIDDLTPETRDHDEHFHPAGFLLDYMPALRRFNDWNTTLADLDGLVERYLR